ncbi:uncharacterized protein EAE97_000478 [Botrytis byssoidea]|uniref:BTB domain-containing protein n=1 Tax=Botrytis byssoidea TaxID=139641 RepID=A0A9P5IVF8_9HELO|nr:uncharacterized protein EAE97_000478 [Botrytis byssoidea]KAF7955219.1 hypothetical protein EAE97_000478 [Botrytis byssoidea]
MASHPPPAPPVHLIIEPKGDLTIRLIDKKTTIDPVTERKSEQTTVLATYRVSRKVLTDNSSVFNTCLEGWAKESKQTTVDIEDGTVKSYELWFRILHQDMIDDMYDLEAEEIYEAIQICGYRQMHDGIKKLRDWSPQWFKNQKIEKKSLDDMRSFLYLTHELDRIEEFQFITRKLAYGMADHIQEANPSRHRHLHLPSRVMGSLNSARGSLRVKLLKGVFDPLDWFIHQRCSCKELSSFAYITGLSKMKIWPIESANKKSIQEILDSFDKFVCVIPEKACMNCRVHLNSIAIKRIRNEIQSSFHGMCLDCMYKSSEGSDMAFVYYQSDLEKEYSMSCRIHHGQSSWYWSNMGKKEDMQAHQERKKRAYERRRFGF